MNISDTQLKKYLLDHNSVGQDDIDIAEKDAEKYDTTLASALRHTGKISDTELRKVWADIMGTSFVSIEKERIPVDILIKIPEPIAKKNNVVAFDEDSDGLHIAMLDTSDIGVIDLIQKTINDKLVPHLTDEESMKKALIQYRKSLDAEFKDIIKESTEAMAGEGAIAEDASPYDLKKIAGHLPIIKIVDTIISHALLQKASDIHIEPEEDSLIIRYRVDGILHDAMTLPKNIAPGVIVRIKILANLRLDEKRLPQDGRFKDTINEQDVSFRVSTLPTYFGEKIVIRVLKDNAHEFTLEDLGLHGVALERVHDAMKQKTGLMLVSGPTGSGKTTTLYTMLDMLNTTDVNISTVEDPIEYQMDRINQTQVRPDIGFTFATGLRSLLRQDPDILMVGEIRDKETASLAVNASLTGHLVLSTIHTSSAAGVIPRMADMGVENFLLVSTVKVVTAQRLVRVLCEGKEAYTLSKNERENLEAVVDMEHMLDVLRKEKVISEEDTWDTITLYRPKEAVGCPSGYKGRIGIHEVLYMTDSVKHAISIGSSESEIEDVAKKEGMMTMLEDGIFKAVQGITTTEEVLRVISD